ncbi:MAG TPA: hypothetical protein VLI04_09440 [Nocardioidaceae bacterium]|nr:hypothetical protein [Nocardioidaceae bacterium]
MLWVLLLMLAIVALAAVVVVYVAFPYRGRRVPRAGWVGDTMVRGVERLPTLDNTLDNRR